MLWNHDFRLYLAGGGLSAIGSQFTTVARAWQIYELPVGLLGLARTVPQIVLAVFGGLLADVLDRRRLLQLVQLTSSATSTSLVVLTVTGAALAAGIDRGCAPVCLQQRAGGARQAGGPQR